MNPYAHMNYSQGVARFLDLFASNSQATAAAECVARHVPSGGSVLDIGAGTGGIGLAIAEAGYRVTMLEPDHEMFAMLLAALAARPGVQERVTPIPRPFGFDTGTAFDAVVCFAVVHLLSPEQRSELIACAARQVRPDGVVILEMPVATSRRVASAWQCVGRMPLGAAVVEHHASQQPGEAGWWYTHWRFRIVLGEQTVDEVERSFRWYPLQPDESTGLITSAGLRIEHEYGGCDQSPYRPHESRVRLVVARVA